MHLGHIHTPGQLCNGQGQKVCALKNRSAYPQVGLGAVAQSSSQIVCFTTVVWSEIPIDTLDKALELSE